MAQQLTAHVFTRPAPQIPLASLKGAAMPTTIAGVPTWVLNPIGVLNSTDPREMRAQFTAWRSKWQQSFALDPSDVVTKLAGLVAPALPIWTHVRSGARLDPQQSLHLYNSLSGVRKIVAARSATAVVLYSTEKPGVLWSWPDGYDSVLASSATQELAVTPKGMEVSCPLCGADPVRRWSLDQDGELEVEVKCSTAQRNVRLDTELSDALWTLSRSVSRVQVLVRPWTVTVARTLHRLEEAAQLSVDKDVPLYFVNHTLP